MWSCRRVYPKGFQDHADVVYFAVNDIDFDFFLNMLRNNATACLLNY